jgi:hypothetical protein
VIASLRSNQEPVAVLPWREFTVADLDRQIRFEHFHGIEGKPDAAAIRDKTLDEWLAEILLRHEADQLGFDERPEIVANADRVRREKIREYVTSQVLEIDYEPTEEEARAYWSEHGDYFTPDPRIRADGVILADRESAERFRGQLEKGVRVKWLAKRADGVADADPELFETWLDPRWIGQAAGTIEAGDIVGPVPVGEQWAVAAVTEIEDPAPEPFEECRNRVVGIMLVDRRRRTMNESLERLEAQAEIEITDGAEDLIAMRIDEWLGTTTTPARR